MKQALFGQHRRLLFRSYLFLAASLLLVAAILDFGFGYLQSTNMHDDETWLVTSFRLVESELSDVEPEDRYTVAQELGERIGVTVQLLQPDQVALPAETSAGVQSLIDDDGNQYFLHTSSLLNSHIRFGPVAGRQESFLLQLLPPLFYVSIFVVVGIWLYPLLKDVNLITSAADRFAADYRKPLDTSEKTTQLTDLAANLDTMSHRLSGLIQSQKELIAALSHEMRTPLARIRFALAVIGNRDDDELHTQIDELNKDVHQIDELVGTMLNYARLDHPDLRMNWQDVPLDAWLSQSEQQFAWPDKSLSIENRIEQPDIPMDPRLMSLALSNLLNNAGRYSNQRVSCTLLQKGTRYRLRVEDDGDGIPGCGKTRCIQSVYPARRQPEPGYRRLRPGSRYRSENCELARRNG